MHLLNWSKVVAKRDQKIDKVEKTKVTPFGS